LVGLGSRYLTVGNSTGFFQECFTPGLQECYLGRDLLFEET